MLAVVSPMEYCCLCHCFLRSTGWQKEGRMDRQTNERTSSYTHIYVYILVPWHSLITCRAHKQFRNNDLWRNCTALLNTQRQNALKNPAGILKVLISIAFILLIGRLDCDAIGSNHWTLQKLPRACVCGHNPSPNSMATKLTPHIGENKICTSRSCSYLSPIHQQ
jgi:hypothetical protein